MREVDPERIGIIGLSYGGKWAMFASCLDGDLTRMTLQTASKRMLSRALANVSIVGHDVRCSAVINNEFKDIAGLARCKPRFMLAAVTDNALVGE